MFRAALPAADASDTSLRAAVEDNMAHRLRATVMEGGRAHDAIHRGFQSDRDFPCDRHPGHPVGIRLPPLLEKARGTLAQGTVSIGKFSRDARISATPYFDGNRAVDGSSPAFQIMEIGLADNCILTLGRDTRTHPKPD